METGEIWIGIIVPIIIGPIFVFFKYLWDKYDEQKTQQKVLQFQEKLDKVKEKLSNFYWPIYIKLICVYQMNYNVPMDSGDSSDSSDSSTSSLSSSSDEESFIKYTRKKIKKCSSYYQDEHGVTKKCNRKIPHNNTSNICRKCRWKKHNKTIKERSNTKPNEVLILDNSSNHEIQESVVDIHIEPLQDVLEANPPENSISIPIEPTDYKDSDDDSLTGDGIGVVRELPIFNLNIDTTTIQYLQKKINNTYQDIIEILKKNISIAEPRTKLGKEITKFIKFAEIHSVIHQSKNKYKISEFGAENNINKLLSLIEIKLFDLQKEYHNLIKYGPFNKENNINL